jgi:hypothetical protein
MPERSREILSQRNKESLRAYEALSKLPFPRSYPGKMLLVAFLGIHVPLLTLIFYLTRCASFSR